MSAPTIPLSVLVQAHEAINTVFAHVSTAGTTNKPLPDATVRLVARAHGRFGSQMAALLGPVKVPVSGVVDVPEQAS